MVSNTNKDALGTMFWYYRTLLKRQNSLSPIFCPLELQSQDAKDSWLKILQSQHHQVASGWRSPQLDHYIFNDLRIQHRRTNLGNSNGEQIYRAFHNSRSITWSLKQRSVQLIQHEDPGDIFAQVTTFCFKHFGKTLTVARNTGRLPKKNNHTTIYITLTCGTMFLHSSST